MGQIVVIVPLNPTYKNPRIERENPFVPGNYNRTMDQKIFHGNLQPTEFANILAGHFNRGNLRVQRVGDDNRCIVQIGTYAAARAGGQTALSIILQRVIDGVSVQVGRQNWVGVAASLGISALAVIRNPFNLIGRLDDIAQDIEYLQLTEEVWRVIENTAATVGSGTELSRRMQRVTCGYCHTANPMGQASCLACGAPLGASQPHTCRRCGFVVLPGEKICPNCKSALTPDGYPYNHPG